MAASFFILWEDVLFPRSSFICCEQNVILWAVGVNIKFWGTKFSSFVWLLGCLFFMGWNTVFQIVTLYMEVKYVKSLTECFSLKVYPKKLFTGIISNDGFFDEVTYLVSCQSHKNNKLKNTLRMWKAFFILQDVNMFCLVHLDEQKRALSQGKTHYVITFLNTTPTLKL